MNEEFLYDSWYAAGWTHDFPDKGIDSRSILDEPLIFYRTTSGTLVAMEDRCCHRLAPLSKGQVEGDEVRCMYHGLKFDCTGKCTEIPGQPNIPPQTRVRVYPVVERHSVAWIWMGDIDKADPALIPEFRGVADSRYAMLPGRMDYDAFYMLINDNLLDLSHLNYVHRNSFGSGDDFSKTRPKITRLDRGLRVERWVLQPTPAYLKPMLPQYDFLDTWIAYDFMVPGVFLMDVYFCAAGTAEKFGMAKPDVTKLEPLHQEFTCQAVTPLTRNSSCYFFAYGPTADLPQLAKNYLDVSYMVFTEDKAMIESQHQTIVKSPAAVMRPTSFDSGPSQFRWLMEKLIKEQNAKLAELA